MLTPLPLLSFRSQLSDEVRTMMKHYVVHPLAVDSPELGRVLSVMMASKVTPELELQAAAGGGRVERAVEPGAALRLHFFCCAALCHAK
jgi:hypothetical protein